MSDMKRTLIIITVFLILAVFVTTGCTCKLEEETTCRGIGHGCIMACVGCFDCAVIDDSGTQSVSGSDIAVEGKHYSKPSVHLVHSGTENMVNVVFQMETYKSFRLNMQICIVQDGILVAEYKFEGMRRPGEANSSEWGIMLNNYYDPEGGELYCFINKFEARAEG